MSEHNTLPDKRNKRKLEPEEIDDIISQNCHGNQILCQDVKNAINRIAFDTNYTNEQQRKEAYNTFYKNLLE